MSHFPELPAEPGQHNLRRALHELPPHEPDESLWTRISAQLATETAVAQALPQLPPHEPDDDLWAVIVGRLDAEPLTPLAVAEASPLMRAAAEAPTEPARTLAPPAAVYRLWPARTWQLAAAAAAAVLVVTLVWWQRPARPAPTVAAVPTAQETVSYSEEVLPAPAAAAQPGFTASGAFDPLQTQGVAFIDAHCTSLPTVCQSAEFQELRTQLSELEAEELRLQQDARRFGKTPELEQHQVRVTTMKATVTRELIQLLIS
ncbi:hypothetical protein GCM10027048_24780 [Hymenobacter coalescens]